MFFRSLVVLLLAVVPLAAQKLPKRFEEVAEITTKVEPAKAKPGDSVTVSFTVTPKDGAWTYTSAKNVFRLPESGDIIFDSKYDDPPGAIDGIDEEGMPAEKYIAATTWTFKATVSPTATPGKKTIDLSKTSIQVCVPGICLKSKKSSIPILELEVVAGGVPAPAPEPRASPPNPAPPQTDPIEKKVEPARVGLVKKNAIPVVEYKAKLDAVVATLDRGEAKLPTTEIWGFLATAALWGWISLVTPCVFPMIPITVSLFLKQGNKSPREVLKLAAVYSLTIVVVIGVAALFVLQVFRDLSVNPWMNIGLGALLIFFALSLFGMYDIALPGFLLRYTEKRRGAGGLVGTVFGALAFSIVSFTCVAPFLGGFAGFAASGRFGTTQLALGAFAFSAAFASPFFLLALFPALIRKLPKSGGWLDTIKAVMGFVEVAAALKFFRTAELRLLSPTQYFTFDVCLAGMIATMMLCGLYLLNLFRLPHDEEKPTIGVGRLLWAMVFLGLALHLAPGLMKSNEGQNQRPTGIVYAWVEAFLLPESAGVGGKELPWDSDLPRALEAARRNSDGRRLVFVDFTGKTCQNCKVNERDIFPRPEIDELLRMYVLVQMYTDEVPLEFYSTPRSLAEREDEARIANQEFQRASTGGDERLPLYMILEPLPNGRTRVLDVYEESKINDPAAFAAFLRKPLGMVK
jgi:thiol:disulfide interchange protein